MTSTTVLDVSNPNVSDHERTAFAVKTEMVAELDMSVKRAANRLIRNNASPHTLLPRVGLTLAEITFAQVCRHAATSGG